MTKKKLKAVLTAVREMAADLCAPVGMTELLFRCLSPDRAERKQAAVEFGTYAGNCVLAELDDDEERDGLSELSNAVNRLHRGRKLAAGETAPAGYEEIWEITGETRQGAFSNKGTAPKKLAVLFKVREYIESEERLPSQSEILSQLEAVVGKDTVSEVFKELRERAEVFFPDVREEPGWKGRRE